MGSGGLNLSPAIPFGDSSIHRFKGKVKFCSYTFIGDGDKANRFTFCFIKDIGYVYLRGKGKVIPDNGKEVELGINNNELTKESNKTTVVSGSGISNRGTTTSSNRENNPENPTNTEKQTQEATVPSLKIKVLEEKKKEKVPLEGAGVYLDGKEIGTTDKAGELFIKETIENYHILEVKKSGYFTFKENIEISEYAEDKIVILYPGITASEGTENGKDEDVPETQEQVTETSK